MRTKIFSHNYFSSSTNTHRTAHCKYAKISDFVEPEKTELKYQLANGRNNLYPSC